MPRLAVYLQNLQRFGIQPGLERIVALLASVGNPHQKYPHILIGGTNGKGSTCEYVARMFAQNGRHIGLYTSPHLYQWNERIRVLPGEGLFAGTICDDELDALFDDALPHIEKVAAELGQPTEFEVLTLLALWHFERVGVDAAVLEVGLGGKWDATNAADPLVSVVTHVALDHMDRLGDTLEKIAADKVCIARPNRPFITGEWKPEVLAVFEAHCTQVGAHFKHIPLSHQNYERQNRALSIVVANEFASQLGWSQSLPDSLMDGVPGRTEKIADSPAIYIDAANNPDGAQKFVEFFHERIPTQPENVILVLGILKDKNWREMAEILVPLARTLICCQSGSPRALIAEELAEFSRNIHPHVEVIADVKLAVERARELAAASDTIVVTGSFTTIAEVPRDANYSP
ncbi:folylpolyglutamate synthase [Abditibacteriota bacterium]|nr:folylpolyglutamate synthase [Abditibacteriota bacterium]